MADFLLLESGDRLLLEDGSGLLLLETSVTPPPTADPFPYIRKYALSGVTVNPLDNREAHSLDNRNALQSDARTRHPLDARTTHRKV